jgi:PAS domain S-box-containing protein
MGFFRQLCVAGEFMPHGYFYMWNPGLVWLHVISDWLIALADFTIPAALLWFGRKRRDLPFSWLSVLFGAFIVACGAAHRMEAWNLWHAEYWLAGGLKAVTVVASVVAAILLVRFAAARRAEVETQRKTAEENRQREIPFRRLIDAVTDYAIISLDANGLVTSWNSGAERLTSYAAEEIIGQHVGRLHLKEDVECGKLAEDLRRAAAEGHMKEEGWRVRKDGSLFCAEAVTTALRGPAGELIGFVKIEKDISARRAAEAQIQELNIELTQRVEELGGANRELESFSYSVSHDLRSPLRHMDGFARILKEEHSPHMTPEAIVYVDRILSAATHMGQLIDDLLNLARIGRLELKRERAQLAGLVKQAIAELPAEAKERNIEWWVEPLPEMNCDARLLKLIFANLLSNAVKFTRKQAAAVIEVGSRVTDGVPTIFVRDNGVGFDMKYADKLFGVFQRLHRQEEFEGTGIGLATVQRIVRRHGGEIWAESQINSGTTFLFTLGPRSEASGEDRATEIKRA